MKRIVIAIGVLVCLTAAHVVFGQLAEGVIHYETKMNLHRNIPAERESMKAMIPEFRTTKEQLFFNQNEVLYKPVIEDNVEEMNTGGMRMMRFGSPQTETYINTDNQMRTMALEFMGKKYLVEDTLKMSPWKFGTETKTILGYVCKQAYFTEEVQVMMGSERQTRTSEVTAWYTDQIRPFLGPDRFNTLPGAVLAVDINGGERVILATKVEQRALKKNELKAPSSGTKVTQEEYRKIVAEQMEKMRQSGGNVIIR
ncbi:MAG: GLPGLI family protein [Cyclobacteriaceae bacterium]|nr:GLPGLI family protein [Cyclobacteriaceae bacterium]